MPGAKRPPFVFEIGARDRVDRSRLVLEEAQVETPVRASAPICRSNSAGSAGALSRACSKSRQTCLLHRSSTSPRIRL
jgi:hypothetical protein